ncbi:MAG: hypothetical protein Q9182_007243 [Xanthomendoza sp. 2 TL-2023]
MDPKVLTSFGVQLYENHLQHEAQRQTQRQIQQDDDPIQIIESQRVNTVEVGSQRMRATNEPATITEAQILPRGNPVVLLIVLIWGFLTPTEVERPQNQTAIQCWNAGMIPLPIVLHQALYKTTFEVLRETEIVSLQSIRDIEDLHSNVNGSATTTEELLTNDLPKLMEQNTGTDPNLRNVVDRIHKHLESIVSEVGRLEDAYHLIHSACNVYENEARENLKTLGSSSSLPRTVDIALGGRIPKIIPRWFTKQYSKSEERLEKIEFLKAKLIEALQHWKSTKRVAQEIDVDLDTCVSNRK